MLEFLPLTAESLPTLRRYVDRCNYRISGYSLTCKLMWSAYYHADYTVYKDSLIYKNNVFGKVFFNYPITDEEREDEVLGEIERYCVEKYIPLVFVDVPQEKVQKLAERYRFMRFLSDRNYEDYLYKAEDFRLFSGKKFAGQRNHIHKFNSLYPNAVFRRFGSEDKPRIKKFFAEYGKNDSTMNKERETSFAKRLVLSLPIEDYLAFGFEIDGKIVSFTFGTKMGDTLFVHIEKALRQYEGVYTATANAFAKANGDAVFINREDDSGTKGMRTSKTQYQPLKTVKKFFIRVENEWRKIDRFPTLKTERLTLDAIRPTDAKAYYDLCTDDERNKYWGYDYKADLKGDLYPEYFYDVQKRDKKEKMCFSFAVRLHDKMIGEGVLYRFTGTGEAEAGIRISREYAGFGYGKEAFYAMTDWALYGLGLDRIVSKCYHENAASYRMLSAGMRITSQDDTFVYFERKV